MKRTHIILVIAFQLLSFGCAFRAPQYDGQLEKDLDCYWDPVESKEPCELNDKTQGCGNGIKKQNYRCLCNGEVAFICRPSQVPMTVVDCVIPCAEEDEGINPAIYVYVGMVIFGCIVTIAFLRTFCFGEMGCPGD